MNDLTQQANQGTGYLSQLLHRIVQWIPNLISAVIIWVISYLVAKAVAALVSRILHAFNLNQHVHQGQVGAYVQRIIPNPSAFLAKLTFWAIYLFGISIAITTLGIPFLQYFVRGIYSYLPNVLAALIIFIAATALSGVVAAFATKTMGDTPTGKLLAGAGPTLVMALATFMILTQLNIAPNIVLITYAGIVATATLAFGLGGREVASQMLQGLYDKGKKYKGQVVADSRTGAARAKSKAQDLRDRPA